MRDAEVVYGILEKLELDAGANNHILVLDGKHDGFLRYPENGYGEGLNHAQQLLLAQELSKECFPNGKERYTLLSLGSAYGLCKASDRVKNLFGKDHYILNKELFLTPTKIISDPYVFETTEGTLEYDGKSIPVEINRRDIFETLSTIDLFNRSVVDVRSGKYRPSIDVASPWFRWDSNHDIFEAGWIPSDLKKQDNIIAFEKTSDFPNIETVFVSKGEYDALRQSAGSWRNIRSDLKDIKGRIDNWADV